MHQAATAFQAQHHFVTRGGEGQQRSDFVAQAFGGRSFDVAIEVQHEDPALFLGLALLLPLFRLGLLLAQGLELGLVEQAGFQALAQVLVELVQAGDLQLPTRFAPPLAAQPGDGRQHYQDGDDQGGGFGEKACVFCKKLHVDSLKTCATTARNCSKHTVAPEVLPAVANAGNTFQTTFSNACMFFR
ncbi:hypothetical protein D3C78_216900 [compost metagenome]